MSKYYDIIDHIDTVESFFGQVLVKNGSLLTPYIGLGIHEHPLNTSSTLKFINYSYIVAIGLRILKVNNQVVINEPINVLSKDQSIFLGGNSLFENQKRIHELDIQADEVFLYVPETSEISSGLWLPIDTPNFEKNIDEFEVTNFISNKFVPSYLGDWSNSSELTI